MYNPPLCYPLSTLLLKGMLFVLCCKQLAARSSNPLHYCWGRCCPFCIRLAARSSTVLPPPYYCWGRCCPFCIRLAARSSTVLSPPTLLLGQMLPAFLCAVGCAILYCATPCTRVGRPFTVLPPYTARRLNAACIGAMRASAVSVTLCCATPVYCTRGICCHFWCDEHRRVGRTLIVLPRTLHLC